MAAIHDPDAADGVPAYVGAMAIAEGLRDVSLLRQAHVQMKK